MDLSIAYFFFKYINLILLEKSILPKNMQIPKILFKNRITDLLDEIRESYGVITRNGVIHGIMVIDQDAKIIALDSMFDRKLNYWDLSSIGAALYGVAKQGQDFFSTEYLERAALIYNNLQLFVEAITDITLTIGKEREILIVLLTERNVNVGVIHLQMKRYAPKIKNLIEQSGSIKATLKMDENELKAHIQRLKGEIFGARITSVSEND